MVPGRKGFNAQGNPAVIWAVILIALLLWSHTHLIENGLVTANTTSVDESGKQHFLDASVAYKRVVLNDIEYLARFGYSKEQVYLLLSCCPCEAGSLE
ncbi:Acetamidase/Formamidase family protein [Zea mays]|uniref:Acetamidase/Formamidase family protein n=1 Tax=Zea mays TaxID=4577 RepID=A0A1D6GBA4_MAIZE|nr:Acetamidase/Formamidase family protein [Zea mays]